MLTIFFIIVCLGTSVPLPAQQKQRGILETREDTLRWLKKRKHLDGKKWYTEEEWKLMNKRTAKEPLRTKTPTVKKEQYGKKHKRKVF